MGELLSPPSRQADPRLRVESATQIGEKFPRLAHVLALLERNDKVAAAANGQSRVQRPGIARGLEELLKPRLAVRLAPLLRRHQNFRRGEQWLVDSFFSRPDATTERSLRRLLWATARGLQRDNLLAEALHVYRALLTRTELTEFDLARALLAALKAGDDELTDLCLDRLVASAAREDRPRPVPVQAVARFVRLLNAILKTFRRTGELERAQTFVFSYLAGFEDLAALPYISPTLRRFVRDLRKTGHPEAARRLRRLLAVAGGTAEGSTPLVPPPGAAGEGQRPGSHQLNFTGTDVGLQEQLRMAILPPPLRASKALDTAALLRRLLATEGTADGGTYLVPPGPPRLASKFLHVIGQGPDTEEATAMRLHRLVREIVSLEPDEIHQVAASLSHRIRTLAASEAAAVADVVAPALELCRSLLERHHLDAARLLLDAIDGLAPPSAELLVLRAYIEKWASHLEEACRLYRQALAMPGSDPTIHFELAEALEFLGDDEGAIAAIKTGLSLCDEDALFLSRPGYLSQSAGPLMRLGRIVEGWEAFQKRRDRFRLAPPCKLWGGEHLTNETLLILSEQGIGDEIRFASCYPDLLARVKKIAVSADPRLCGLLERSFPNVTFIPSVRGAASGWRAATLDRKIVRLSRALTLDLFCLASSFDYLCMAGDLPLHLRRDRTAFPRHSGYLIPDPEKRREWRARLDGLGPGLKVGLSWRSTNHAGKRSQHYFTLEELLPLLEVEGVHFVNLQYDDCEAELAWLEERHGKAVHRWRNADLQNDLDGVAALMTELDLVIAPHTMVKELAGAVGAPTLFMAPTDQAWVRWRADPETGADIWHPSLKHVQSTRAGNKESVLIQTRAQLERIVAERGRTPDLAPVPAGLHSGSGRRGEEKQDIPGPTAKQVLPPKALVNAYGESYVPAPTTGFPNNLVRNREWLRREMAFRSSCEDLLSDAAQPEAPEGVFLMCAQGSLKQHALTLLGAHGLLERGWAIAFLENPPLEFDPCIDPDVAYFQEILNGANSKAEGDSKRRYLHREHGVGLCFQWEIDWPNKVCRAQGMNFYGVIAARLGKEFRCYSPDISMPGVSKRFKILLQSCDSALRVCLDAEERFGQRKLPVRITGFEPNYPPTGVFKVYCAERGHAYDIEFVEIRNAYETYFRAGKAGFVGAIDVQNVTRHGLAHPSVLLREQFESWYERHRDDPQAVEQAMRWVRQDRSSLGKPSKEGEIVLERIRRHRAAGGKVACLYGHVPYDFGHPWIDQGPAHSSMADWLNHTVESLTGSDVLLLVKPHPSESDVEMFGRPERYFHELLEVPPSENICLLGHRWLNNLDLVPYMDLGIVWRSTIATELALVGIRVVRCAPYAANDQVLPFTMPSDRKHYQELIRDPMQILPPTDEFKRRAAMTFEFYRTEVMIEYPFGWIPHKRHMSGPPAFSNKAITEYLKNGHTSVDKICNRIILG